MQKLVERDLGTAACYCCSCAPPGRVTRNISRQRSGGRTCAVGATEIVSIYFGAQQRKVTSEASCARVSSQRAAQCLYRCSRYSCFTFPIVYFWLTCLCC